LIGTRLALLSIVRGAERTEEPFIGEVWDKDGKKVMLADTDGYLWGEIDGETLSFCYAQAGKPLSLVSCSEVKRAT